MEIDAGIRSHAASDVGGRGAADVDPQRGAGPAGRLRPRAARGRSWRRRLALAGALLAVAPAAGVARAEGSAAPLHPGDFAAPPHPAQAVAQQDAERGDAGEGTLEPTYRPRPPEPEPAYDSSYLFALTRGVAGSTLVPAVKVPLFVFTIPLDVVLLPVAAIAGFF